MLDALLPPNVREKRYKAVAVGSALVRYGYWASTEKKKKKQKSGGAGADAALFEDKNTVSYTSVTNRVRLLST